MGKNEYLDGENLEWQERLFRLRKKYRETPPGFREAEEEEKSLRDLRRIRKEYEERKKYRIRSGYRALQECFVGRERYLTRIEEILAEKSGPAVLYGIGGIGKTAIARAYVRRHQEEYDSVLFLSCDIGFSPLLCDDIRVAVSNLHYSKDKYGSKKQYFKEKMKALTEIGEESRFLLVLDDCNREADPYMEQIFALPCDILVTTRVDPAMWGVAGGIPVTELEPGREWEEFVRAYRGSEPTQEEWKEYREYRERIGGYTLLMMLKLHGVEPGKDASGTMEMIAPIKRTLPPIFSKAGTNSRPACKPTTAMNRFKPTLFKNQRVEAGILPWLACLSWYQPKNKPRNNAPPPVPRVNGIVPRVITIVPSKIPKTIPIER